MLKGQTFDKQLFTSSCFSLFIDTFLGGHNGIIKGCELSHTNDNIIIDDGYFCVKGRFCQEEGGTTINVEKNTAYCILVCEIDLNQSNSTTAFNQGSYKIITATEDYPELIQEDITNNGKIYQYELARFTTTINGIDVFQDTRTFLDFDDIYTEIQKGVLGYTVIEEW